MQDGSIVFVSSISAFQPSAPLGMYAVSKTALVSILCWSRRRLMGVMTLKMDGNFVRQSLEKYSDR